MRPRVLLPCLVVAVFLLTILQGFRLQVHTSSISGKALTAPASHPSDYEQYSYTKVLAERIASKSEALRTDSAVRSRAHEKKYRKCRGDVEAILKERGSTVESSAGEICRSRVRRGENVLLEQLLQFVRDWDEAHDVPFLCDLLQGPRLTTYNWSEIDHVFDRDDLFSWELFSHVPANATKVFYFPAGKQFCNLFDLESFHKHCRFKFIVLGPFGDGSNFGPFSGGPYVPFFKMKNSSDVMQMLCSHQRKEQERAWVRAQRLLEDDRLIAWISFQQNVEHPKLVSMPIGASNHFINYAMSSAGLRKSLTLSKEKLLGVTFTHGYSDRSHWLDALDRAHYLNKTDMEVSQINPWHVKGISKREAWGIALETPRKSRIIISPGGMGVDTKRPAESILVGSVPLHVMSNGLHKTYRNLPVLWVFSHDEFYALESRLEDLLCTGKQFNFAKLTYEGWHEVVRDLKTGRTIMDAVR